MKHNTQILFDAIEAEDVDQVLSLLQQGAQVNETNEEAAQPLHIACTTLSTTIVDILLDAGADIFARDNWGMTPLAFAAWLGREEIVRLLLERGAGEDKQDLQRAIRSATRDNGHNVIPILMEYGAHFGLVEAIYMRDDKKVHRYFTEGVDVNHVEYGDTLLIHATKSSLGDIGRETYLPLLLSLGADVNAQSEKDGYTALMVAAERGYPNCVQLLLEHGADPTIQGKTGETALNLAIANQANNGGVIALLQSKLSVYKEHGVRFSLVEAIYMRDDETVHRYLADGIDVNHVEDGDTLLIYATMSSLDGLGHETYLPLLLNLGADVNAQSKHGGYTALMIASCNNYPYCVQLLLEHEADPNIQDMEGETALNYAITNQPNDDGRVIALLQSALSNYKESEYTA